MQTHSIHHGEGTDGKLDLPRIAEVSNATKPDLFALQEVDKKTAGTKKVDQAAELGKLTGMNVEFGKAKDFQGGGTCSRSCRGFRSRTRRRTICRVRVARSPDRSNAGHGRARQYPAITFLNTHLQHDDGETREKQVARIDELFAKADGAVILTGDLNAAPGSGPLRPKQRAGDA